MQLVSGAQNVQEELSCSGGLVAEATLMDVNCVAGHSMENRKTKDMLPLAITGAAWIVTLAFVAVPAVKTFEPTGDSVAGQFMYWLVAGWVAGMTEGMFFGVRTYLWTLAGFLYLIGFGLSHSHSSFPAKASLLYAGILFVLPLAMSYLGPACVGTIEAIKSNPSEYTLTVRDAALVLLTMVTHCVFLIELFPIVTVAYSVDCRVHKITPTQERS